uniref:Uncharacterized protein n=1 Tax=Noctiluca scintillans TaxID=2966 RepID=A0A7S1ALG1_NOCSC
MLDLRSATVVALTVAARAVTSTTTTATTTDGGGWPWWAWFLLMLGICCCLALFCGIPGGFAWASGSKRKEQRAADFVRPVPLQTPVITTVPIERQPQRVPFPPAVLSRDIAYVTTAPFAQGVSRAY